MNEPLFKITIKVKHKLGESEFTLGELYGITRIITGSVPIKGANLKKDTVNDVDEYGNKFFHVKCSKRQFKELARTIERIHPDLCIFDIKGLI